MHLSPTDREDLVSAIGFSLLRFLALSVVVALLVPPAVFSACGILAGMGIGGTVGALAAQYGTDRLNLLVLGLVGAIPFAFLTLVLVLYRRFGSAEPVRAMAMGGGLVVVVLLAWAHGSYWPSFLPEGVAPMWPHGIEFVVVPLFFAPVGALAGMLGGWLVHRSGASG